MKCKKIFLGIVFGFALLMGILVLALPQEKLDILVLISRFIEAMIPVLAIGALIKYLYSSSSDCCKSESSDSKKASKCSS
ncbi:MAG: hypothetical protein LEGION0398_MBIBDBAK_00999 [Legionellaceae bacterium]